MFTLNFGEINLINLAKEQVEILMCSNYLRTLTNCLGLMLYKILSAFSLSPRLSMIAKRSFDASFWKKNILTSQKEKKKNDS